MTKPDTGGRGEGRAEALFDFLVEEVDRHLNPNNDECWHCGGDGYVADCFDGLCADAESGCEDCTRRCPECAINAGQRAKAIREEVINTGDVDVAREWLKSVGRWHDGITPEQISEQLSSARAARSADSAKNGGGK